MPGPTRHHIQTAVTIDKQVQLGSHQHQHRMNQGHQYWECLKRMYQEQGIPVQVLNSTHDLDQQFVQPYMYSV